MKRPGSANGQFVQRLPADLRSRMVGMRLEMPVGNDLVAVKISPKMETIRLSLRSSDPSVVKERQAQAAGYLERVYRALRATAPETLDHRQVMALAGERAKAFLEAHEGDPFQVPPQRSGIDVVDVDDTARLIDAIGSLGHLDRRAAVAAWREYVAAPERERLSLGIGLLDRFKVFRDVLAPDFAAIIDGLHGHDSRAALLRHGLNVDRATRDLLSMEIAPLMEAARRGLERRTWGDYRPVEELEHLPAFESKQPAKPQVSLRGLVAEWWKEASAAGLSESTKESYGKAIAALADFLGHDDAGSVSEADVLRFKDHLFTIIHPRTKKPLEPKTIKDGYFSGLKSVLGWAAANKKIGLNPADGIPIKIGKRVRLRDSWFSPEEVSAILSASANLVAEDGEPFKRYAAKRWVPWLCAYTGARVGEIAQLRKQDVRHDGTRWVISITPDAITVKGNERREVPLHEHLVATGFPAFLEAASEGFLFLWSGDDRSALRTAKNRLRDFVRAVVPDPNVQPNHGWRHTFKTVGSEAGIEARTLDAICGHDPRTVGESYGGVTLLAKARAIERFPRFEAARPTPSEAAQTEGLR